MKNLFSLLIVFGLLFVGCGSDENIDTKPSILSEQKAPAAPANARYIISVHDVTESEIEIDDTRGTTADFAYYRIRWRNVSFYMNREFDPNEVVVDSIFAIQGEGVLGETLLVHCKIIE